MFPHQNFTSTVAFKALSKHSEKAKNEKLKDLFRDKQRFEKFSVQFGDILLDYSKNHLSAETLKLLIDLAVECGLKDAVNAMFKGEIINETEGRAVLHTALRNPKRKGFMLDGKDILPDIHKVLDKMEVFSNQVIKGDWKGYSGKAIADIVILGSGGLT
jgi:glucose-6-phosphate isomerase